MSKHRCGEKWLLIGLMVCGFCGLAPNRARADMSWESVTTAVFKLPGALEEKINETHQGFSLKANVLRIDDRDEGGARFLNFQLGDAVFVNFRSRSFMVFSFLDLIQSLQAEREQLKLDLAAREAQLASLSGPERVKTAAQIEAQKKKYEIWSHPYSTAATTTKATVNGHPCLLYQGLSNGAAFQEIWVATDVTLDPGYLNFFAKVMIQLDPQEYSYLAYIRGFPIKVVSHYGAVTVTTSVNQVSNAVLPLEAFTIPAGFRLATPPAPQ